MTVDNLRIRADFSIDLTNPPTSNSTVKVWDKWVTGYYHEENRNYLSIANLNSSLISYADSHKLTGGYWIIDAHELIEHEFTIQCRYVSPETIEETQQREEYQTKDKKHDEDKARMQRHTAYLKLKKEFEP